MTPPNVFTQQNTEQQPTHSKVPDLKRKRQGAEKEKDHRLTRAAPSIQKLGIPEETGHTGGEEQIWGLRVQEPDPCGWGRAHTIPRPGVP